MSELPPGADIEMWNAGKPDPDRKIVRPSKIRINGAQIITDDASSPCVHIRDFGGRAYPLVVDIKGIVVRSLKIHPVDPSAEKPQVDFKVLNNLAPGAAEAAKVGAELVSTAWQRRIAEGLVKPGQHPKLPNMASQRPSYWRRVWNAVRGH